MDVRCDIIIPAKNAPWWLALCLEELFRSASRDELGQVLVVDDGSTPDDLAVIQRICATHSGVRLLRNTGRPGFGGACNFGVQHATAPYLLFLNTDCLITRGTVRKLVAACQADPATGMACPLSNNSPCLTLPLAPGRSYVEMNALLAHASAGLPPADVALDVCTVVGNCLLISRQCWEKTGEFSEVWGLGYGEESDYQMRAMDRGFRGVALVNTYVYHFGNATFRYEPGANALREKNLGLFHATWGSKYEALLARQKQRDPVATATQRLAALPPEPLRPPVLFVLPGIRQGVGGIHVVLDLCNHLIRQGIEARCAVLGSLDQNILDSYQEPILFGLLHFPDELTFVAQTDVLPRSVAATLYTTVPPAYMVARMHGVPLLYFVQGYECLFGNGTAYNQAVETYAMADHLLVTSDWLKERVHAHAPGKPLTVLPIGIDPNVFAASNTERPAERKTRIGMVLRNAADKGQWILLGVLEELARHKELFEVTLFAAAGYSTPRGWEQNSTCVQLPVDHATIAAHLRTCDVFVDASLHEGFGLLPLEAMSCGATVVVSDSGGVNQYVRSGVNGIVITEVNQPERYAAAILSLAQDKVVLSRLRTEARTTAAAYRAPDMYARYAEFLTRSLATAVAPPDPHLAAWLRPVLTMLCGAARHTTDARVQEYDALCRARGTEIERLSARLHQLDAQFRARGEQHARLVARLADLESEREQIVGGASFRLGRLLTAPLRALLGKS